MYDHTFYKLANQTGQTSGHTKWAVSLVILHMVTSIFLLGLCGYVWLNILTLSPLRGGRGGGIAYESLMEEVGTHFLF